MRIHTGEKAYSSNICRKYFSRYGSSTKQLGRNSGEKEYSYDIDKETSAPSIICILTQITIGVKPHRYIICQILFSYSTNMIRIVRIIFYVIAYVRIHIAGISADIFSEKKLVYFK